MTKTLRQDGYKIKIYNNRWEDDNTLRSSIFSIYKEKELFGCGVLSDNKELIYDEHKKMSKSIFEKIKKKALKFWEKYNKYDSL